MRFLGSNATEMLRQAAPDPTTALPQTQLLDLREAALHSRRNVMKSGTVQMHGERGSASL